MGWRGKPQQHLAAQFGDGSRDFDAVAVLWHNVIIHISHVLGFAKVVELSHELALQQCAEL
jgi:hypothetical protein